MKLEQNEDLHWHIKNMTLKEFYALKTFVDLQGYEMNWGDWLNISNESKEIYLQKEGFYLFDRELHIAQEFIAFMEKE